MKKNLNSKGRLENGFIIVKGRTYVGFHKSNKLVNDIRVVFYGNNSSLDELKKDYPSNRIMDYYDFKHVSKKNRAIVDECEQTLRDINPFCTDPITA